MEQRSANTCDVDNIDGVNPSEIEYTGTSLDEITFIEMCRDVGVAYFIQRDSNVLKICILGRIETYEVLRVVEFNSERKRMSVIVKDQSNGSVHSFVKGADMVIMERMQDGAKKQDQ